MRLRLYEQCRPGIRSIKGLKVECLHKFISNRKLLAFYLKDSRVQLMVRVPQFGNHRYSRLETSTYFSCIPQEMKKISVFEIIRNEIDWLLGGATSKHFENVRMISNIDHKSNLSEKFFQPRLFVCTVCVHVIINCLAYYIFIHQVSV